VADWGWKEGVVTLIEGFHHQGDVSSFVLLGLMKGGGKGEGEGLGKRWRRGGCYESENDFTRS